MSYSKIRAYLQAHPTPWRIADGYRFEGVGRDGVVETAQVWTVLDANTAPVLPPCEPSQLVEEFVDFVNLVGEGYEPPCGWHTAYDPTAGPRWPEELRPFSPEQRQAIADSWEPPNWEEGPLERFVRGYLDGEDK